MPSSYVTAQPKERVAVSIFLGEGWVPGSSRDTLIQWSDRSNITVMRLGSELSLDVLLLRTRFESAAIRIQPRKTRVGQNAASSSVSLR